MRFLRRIIIIALLCSAAVASLSLSYHNFNFEPQYSDQLGFSFNSTYSQALSPSNAFLVEGDYGNNQYRLGLTWGHQLTLMQRVKLTFERLAEHIGYNFNSGTVNQWSGQNAVGGDYQILLPNSHLNAFDISGYYAKADSDQLTPVIFANNTLINYRNIAGATSEGAGAGLNFTLWENALLNTTVNYDDMVYHTIYENAPNASGLGETVSFEQLLSPVVKIKLLQSHRQIYDQYEAGLNWLLPARPTTQLQLGVDLAHYNSHTALGDENRVGLKLSYSWDLPADTNNFYGPLSNSTQDLAAWTNQPAVHMEQVLTTVDQKTVAAPQQPSLLSATAPAGLTKSPYAPVILNQIPNQSFIILPAQVNIPLNKNYYFQNPSPTNPMTLSVTGLPNGLTATPSNDVNLISGTANQSNAGTYTITVTAYNGPNVTPHDPNFETSQTFTLQIGSGTGPVYNGNGMTNGEYGQQYSYDLSQDFTPTGTTITAVTGLPTGLTLSGNKVTGQPQQAGVIPLTVTAQANGISIQQPINLTIVPHYNGNGMPAGTVNQTYTYDLHQDFLPNTATIAVTGNLPAGMQNNNGIISGTPTVAGTFTLSVVATVNGASTAPQQINLIINPANGPVYNGKGITQAEFNKAYAYDLSQDFSPASTTITSVTGLPANLTLQGNIVAGTPQQAGVFPITVTASANGTSIQQPMSLTIVPHYNGNGMPAGTINQNYSYDLHQDFDPSTATISVSGNLPTGMQNNSGIISGTPTAAGTFPLSVVATVNGASTAPQQINLIINSSQGPSYTGPTNLPAGSAYKAYSGFNLTNDFSPAGTVITATNLPTGLTFDSSSGTISGTPIKAGNYKLNVSATYNNITINPNINLAITTTQGNLACPDSMANPAKMQSNDGVETYTFTGAPSIAGQTWFKSDLQGNTLSCHYYLGSLHVTTTISTQITDATVSGSSSCNTSRTSCAVTTTYGS